MDIKKRFGQAVQRRRQAEGISQEELAMRIGVDQAYMSRIETGQANVTLETLEQLALAVGVDFFELLYPPEDADDS